MENMTIGDLRNFLEIIYFLSGPVIAFIAVMALGQIRVAKQQIEEQRKLSRTISRRDALKLTADQVALYCEKVIPLQNSLDAKLRSQNIDLLDKFVVQFDSGTISLTSPKGGIPFEVFDRFAKEFVDAANAMESFSTYFASGVADEQIAYLSLGSTFCNSMKRMAPILIPLGNNGRRFSAALRLYSIWGPRLESEALEKQRIEIENKLGKNKQVFIGVVGDQ